MTNLKFILITIILVLRVYSDYCTLPDRQRSQLYSTIIDISKNYNISTNQKQNSTSYQYNHNFLKPFYQSPQLIFGIINIDTADTKNLYLQIKIQDLANQWVIFNVQQGQFNQWSKMVLNLMATTRQDLQIGYTATQINYKQQKQFTLGYLTTKQWNNKANMRMKFFLQGIKIFSNNEPAYGIQYISANLTVSKIDLFFKKNHQKDEVYMIRVGLIVYQDQINGALYSDAFLEQNVLGSRYTYAMQKKGIENLDTFVSGLASFEIDSKTPLKFGLIVDNFFNVIIENNGGSSSKLCVSVLILEMKQCGNCGNINYFYNNSCIEKCPQSYINEYGSCTKINCSKNDSSCFKPCKVNQVYQYGKCVCKDGYKINDQCRTCPVGQRYNYRLKQCVVTDCGQNSFFVNGQCKCYPGYIKLGGICFPCPNGFYFDDNTQKCQRICPQDQVYLDRKCICPNGQYKINGKCGQCSLNSFYQPSFRSCECNPGYQMYNYKCIPICNYGFKYNNNTGKCQSVCPQNQQLISGICLCKPELQNNNGKCLPCGPNTIYDYNTRRCFCITNYYIIDGICKQCPVYSSFDARQQKCICNDGFKQQNLKCVPDCKQNEVPYLDKCFCKSGFYLIDGKCQNCTQNQYYDQILQKCACKSGYIPHPLWNTMCIRSCGNNEILINNQCVCIEGYYRVDGQCQKCYPNSKYDQNKKKCICYQGYQFNSKTRSCDYICKENQEFKNGYCYCKYGFVNINGVCYPCPSDSTYDINLRTCKCYQYFIYNPNENKCYPDCRDNQVLLNGRCVCKENYQFLNRYCTPCPSKNSRWDISSRQCICDKEYKFNQNTNSCVPICPKYQYYQNQKCECIPNYYRHSYTNQCIQCPGQSIYDSLTKTCKCYSPLIFNEKVNRCEPNCKQYEQFSEGKCICIPDFYKIDGVCQKCPQYSKYNYVTQKCDCIDGYREQYQGQRKFCIKKCKTNQILINGVCQCIIGFYRIDGICQSCPQNSQYSINSQKCQCKKGYIFDHYSCVKQCGSHEILLNGQCICEKDYYKIRGLCRKCEDHSYFSQTTYDCQCYDGYYKETIPGYDDYKCILKCKDYQTLIRGLCQCKSGLYRMASGICDLCPQNSKYAELSKQCVCIKGYVKNYQNKCELQCDYNQILYQGNCICKDGLFKINGKCAQCPLNSKYNPFTSTCECLLGYRLNTNTKICELDCSVNEIAYKGVCQCVKGFYKIDGRCQQCPRYSKYNSYTQKCECQSGYEMNRYGECILKCKQNEYLVNGNCQCVQNYYKINGVCQKCWENSYWDPFGKTCQCNYGYIFNYERKKCEIKCKQNQILVNQLCVCKSNYYLINGYCQTCPQNSVYDNSYKDCLCLSGYVKDIYSNKCIIKCSINQILVNGKCVCIQGYFNISSKCDVCPLYSTYNSYKQGCDCDRGYYFDYASYSCKIQCRQNEVLKDNYCQCIDGYVFIKDKCTKQPKCPKLSLWNGYQCQCLLGYLVNNQCVSCSYNQVFNGMECVCISGYQKNYLAKQCQPNQKCYGGQVWSQKDRTCVCPPNSVWIMQKCRQIKNCQENSYWNGYNCTCNSGYYQNNGRCYPIPKPNPRCPSYSYFNGVYCCCLAGYYQIRQGMCEKCPVNTYWNGHSCSQKTKLECETDYYWNYELNGCYPIGQRCGQNEFWNGLSCDCKDSFNKINGRCMKCDQGSFYDGDHCVPGYTKKICSGTSQIWNGISCVCKDSFYMIDGRCRQCPQWTKWNGSICQSQQSSNKWCRSITYSRWQGTDCLCQDGYKMNHGICLSLT